MPQEPDADTTGFSAEEKAAIQEYAKEKQAAKKRGKKGSREQGEADIREKIAALEEPDRSMAERVHAVITEAAPELVPRTWYGMPAYNLDGKVLCHFQPASKFKTRYATLGFSDEAHLDDGSLWPNAYAVTELTPEVEARIAELVRKAVG